MSWIQGQSGDVKKNAEILIKRLNAKGITNPFSQAGLLAVVSKESSLMPKNEKSYRNTSVDRIRKVFGSRVAGLTDPQLESLKQNDAAFFDQVYGAKWPKLGLGNDQPGDGYKYRGRGFNQITGKAAYKKYGDLAGIDLVKDPDLLNDVAVAADVLIAFYQKRFKDNPAKVALYNSNGINDFKNVQDSTNAFYHANTGWGKSQSEIKADPTGGYAKATQRGPEFLDYVKQFTGQTVDLAKKKPVATILITVAVVISVYALYKTLKTK